jgi:hypothetical protein
MASGVHFYKQARQQGRRTGVQLDDVVHQHGLHNSNPN